MGCFCRSSSEKYENYACLGFRRIIKGEAQPFEFMTYKEVQDKVEAVGSALKALGLSKYDKVGVLGTNCPEWMVTMQVCWLHLTCRTKVLKEGHATIRCPACCMVPDLHSQIPDNFFQ